MGVLSGVIVETFDAIGAWCDGADASLEGGARRHVVCVGEKNGEDG